jgi:hypothetical protein
MALVSRSWGNHRMGGFDADPTCGWELIELLGFGITAASFGAHVAIAVVVRTRSLRRSD